jgi:ABC-type antimicrobial peptide transport system permease subunit
VRIALGAQPREVINQVVRHGLHLVALGLGAGLMLAFALANLLAGMLYGVSPHDPPTFAAVPALLAVVALFACWLPSRRATLIEPNAALRSE